MQRSSLAWCRVTTTTGPWGGCSGPSCPARQPLAGRPGQLTSGARRRGAQSAIGSPAEIGGLTQQAQTQHGRLLVTWCTAQRRPHSLRLCSLIGQPVCDTTPAHGHSMFTRCSASSSRLLRAGGRAGLQPLPARAPPAGPTHSQAAGPASAVAHAHPKEQCLRRAAAAVRVHGGVLHGNVQRAVSLLSARKADAARDGRRAAVAAQVDRLPALKGRDSSGAG